MLSWFALPLNLDTGYSFGWGKIGTKNDQTGEELSGTTCQSSKLVFFFFSSGGQIFKKKQFEYKKYGSQHNPKMHKAKTDRI